MTTKLRPFDIEVFLLKGTGRICGVEGCNNTAHFRIVWSELPFFGRGVRKHKYRCVVHYVPATEAKVSA